MIRPRLIKNKPSFITISQERDNSMPSSPLSPGVEHGCYPRPGLKPAASARDLKTRASSCQISTTWRSDESSSQSERRSSSTGTKSGKPLATLNTLVSWLRDSKKSNIKSSRSILELDGERHSTDEISISSRRRSETIDMIKSSTLGYKNRQSRSHRLNSSPHPNQIPFQDDETMKSSPQMMKTEPRIMSIHKEKPKSEPSTNRLGSEIPTRFSLEVYEEEDGDDHSSFHTIDGRDEETYNKDGFCLPKWPGASQRWSTSSHASQVPGQWSVSVGSDGVLLPVQGLEDGQADASTSTR
ncbi:hypothetical protein DFH28DRAFT_952753 [Melampsora americana]|nr:hypothetical protein DFH28DRAFT_952753 [Melampsora americana]